MPLFVYPSKYTYKPPLGSRLQRGSSLAANLVSAWLFNEGGGTTIADAAGSGINGYTTITLPSSDVMWAVGQNGICVNRDGAVNTNRGTLSPSFSSGLIFTIATGLTVQSTSTNHYSTVLTNGSTAGLWLKGASSSTFNINYFYSNADHISSTPLNINQYYNIVLVVNSGVLTYYYNNISDGTFSGVPNINFDSILSDSNVEILNGNLEYIYFWNRALTAGEVTQLHTNPFVMFQSPPVRFVMIVFGATLKDVVSVNAKGNCNYTGKTTAQDFVSITASASINHNAKVSLQDVASINAVSDINVTKLIDHVYVIASASVNRTANATLQNVVSISAQVIFQPTIFSFVQSNSFASSSNTSFSLAFPSNVTKNHLLIVAIQTNGNIIVTLSDTLLNTYTQVGGYVSGLLNGDGKLSLWYTISSASGANTVTITSGATICSFAIHEYKGNVTTNVLDATVHAIGSSIDIDSGTCSVNQNNLNDLLFVACSDGGGGIQTINAGAGFTLRETQLNGSQLWPIGTEDQFTSVDTDGTFTMGASNHWIAIAASFRGSNKAFTSNLTDVVSVSATATCARSCRAILTDNVVFSLVAHTGLAIINITSIIAKSTVARPAKVSNQCVTTVPITTNIIRFASVALNDVVRFLTYQSGTWQVLTNACPDTITPNAIGGGVSGPGGVDVPTLLTDGRLMIPFLGSLATTNAPGRWYTLTPDSTGGYVNATWTRIADNHVCRQSMPTGVLPSGKFYLIGGENTNSSTQSSLESGDLYDPVTNTWSQMKSPPNGISNIPTTLITTGNLLVGNNIYNPTTDTWTLTSTPVNQGITDCTESAYIILKNNKFLFSDIYKTFATGQDYYEIYDPETDTWADANSPLPQRVTMNSEEEAGPGITMYDGRVMLIGTKGTPLFYDVDANSWSVAPVIPNGYTTVDFGCAVLPNGNVIVCANEHISSLYGGPYHIFEYSVDLGQFFDITPPSNIFFNNFFFYPLVLPTGQLLITQDATLSPILYTPVGNPKDEWRPTITSIVTNSDGSYTLTGTQLTGNVVGGHWGDDQTIATNYPIIKLSDTHGNAWYAKTHDWSFLGINSGSMPVTTKFDLPAGFNTATTTLTVMASGVSSQGTSFTIPVAILQDTVSITAIGGVHSSNHQAVLTDVVNIFIGNHATAHLLNQVNMVATSHVSYTGQVQLPDTVNVNATGKYLILDTAILQNNVGVIVSANVTSNFASLQSVSSINAAAIVGHNIAVLYNQVTVNSNATVVHVGNAMLQDTVALAASSHGIFNAILSNTCSVIGIANAGVIVEFTDNISLSADGEISFQSADLDNVVSVTSIPTVISLIGMLYHVGQEVMLVGQGNQWYTILGVSGNGVYNLANNMIALESDIIPTQCEDNQPCESDVTLVVIDDKTIVSSRLTRQDFVS